MAGLGADGDEAGIAGTGNSVRTDDVKFGDNGRTAYDRKVSVARRGRCRHSAKVFVRQHPQVPRFGDDEGAPASRKCRTKHLRLCKRDQRAWQRSSGRSGRRWNRRCVCSRGKVLQGKCCLCMRDPLRREGGTERTDALGISRMGKRWLDRNVFGTGMVEAPPFTYDLQNIVEEQYKALWEDEIRLNGRYNHKLEMLWGGSAK